MKLLEEILQIFGVSGDEAELSTFICNYVSKRAARWKVTPQIYFGELFQDSIILKFGNPKAAVFAHLDTVGFTCRYKNQLVPVGGPEVDGDVFLVGKDKLGPIRCKTILEDGLLFHDFPRAIEVGTNLSFEQHIYIKEGFIQAAYLDNRVGIYNALRLCEDLENGLVVFSTYEEHGGGSVPFLIKFIYEKWQINKMLVSDVTWVTDGVFHNKGTVISMRDRYIPRRSFLNKIINLADKSGVPYQMEVEGQGGSDGKEIQLSPYPVDWCFIGPAESNVHTPKEKVALHDLQCTMELYKYLLRHL